MLQDLVEGRQVSLTKNQRDWVNQVYESMNLRGKVTTLAPVPKVREKAPDIWSTKGPLKPPGK